MENHGSTITRKREGETLYSLLSRSMRDWEVKGGGQDWRKGLGYGFNYISVDSHIFNGSALKGRLNTIFGRSNTNIDAFLQIFKEYQGEVDKRYGVSQEALIEDKRTMVFEEPDLLENIVDYYKHMIQRAKEEPDKHFIVDSNWGVFDIDKLMDLTEEDLENYLIESRTVMIKTLQKCEEPFKQQREALLQPALLDGIIKKLEEGHIDIEDLSGDSIRYLIQAYKAGDGSEFRFTTYGRYDEHYDIPEETKEKLRKAVEERKREKVLSSVQENLRTLEEKRKERDTLRTTQKEHLMEENEEMLEENRDEK